MDKLIEFLEKIPFIGDLFGQHERVAVIRLSGVIADSAQMKRAGISHHKFTKIIDRAFEVKNLKAVALVINSPGGAPAQCALISAQIRRLAQEKDMPVYAFVEDVAASGGYWLACAADHIYAQETSVVGSIGVISAGFGLEDFIKRYDIKRRIYTSGKDKSFLDPFRPEKSEDISRLRDLQEQMHDSFKNWVRERRAGKITAAESDVMEGAFWTGTDALEKGLIDGIGDAASVMTEKFGEDIKLVDLSPEKGFLSGLNPLGAEAKDDWIADALATAETRAFWSRFGL